MLTQTPSAITAIGTSSPAYRRQQLDAVELVGAGLGLKPGEKRRLKSLYKSTGIECRYSVLEDYAREPGNFEFFPNDPDAPFPTTSARMQVYKEHALPLAVAASLRCLAKRPMEKHRITHLITISCTGMYAPGLDIELVQALNLNPAVQRTAINFMGCYGAFNGLKVANAICQSQSDAIVLLVSVELCSIHFQQKTTLDSFIANAIFADGAAAALIEKKPKDSTALALETFHCDIVPQTNEAMAWHIGDSGFDIVLSSYIPKIIETGIAAFSQRLLDAYGLTHTDIGLYAIHPGGIKILQACEAAFHISPEQNGYAYQILRDYGNMSSATVLFVLQALWQDLHARDDQKTILSCAFGPGLTLESMLLTVNFFQR